jgi:hypothetical protein
MALLVTNRNEFDAAKGHCHRGLADAIRLGVEGEDKTTLILIALDTYVNLRQRQGDFSGAVTFAEEAYNNVVDAYDPIHPRQVQEAAGMLIFSMIQKGDLFNFERFAQQTYENLRDCKNGVDQEGDEVANGSYNLANVIHRQDGDLLKAEKLARSALLTREHLNSNNEGSSCNLLGKFEDKTQGLFERCLAICLRSEGPDGLNTAKASISIVRYYYELARRQPTVDTKRKYVLVSKSHIEEGFRIQTKIHGLTHPNTIETGLMLSVIMNELSRHDDDDDDDIDDDDGDNDDDDGHDDDYMVCSRDIKKDLRFDR